MVFDLSNFNASYKCQAIASPSLSSSLASQTVSASEACFLSCFTTSFFYLETIYNPIPEDAGLIVCDNSEGNGNDYDGLGLFTLSDANEYVLSIIIDNLNRLEVAVADIIAYPNLENRDELLEAVADEFTKDDVNVSDEMEYLLSALRGGIFNQGGPAIGDLGRSERNRSREAMDMVHTMIMSGPQ